MIDEKSIKSTDFYGMRTEDFLKKIDAVISKGDRVELIPVKDGVKVVRVRRGEVKE